MSGILGKLKENLAFTWKHDKQFFIKTALIVLVFIVVFISFIINRFDVQEKNTAESDDTLFHDEGILISNEPFHAQESAAGISAGAGLMKNENNEEIADVIMYVDVSGAVCLPGVYMLPEGSRVFEAIEKAGGLANNAETANINLVSKLIDGDKLYIPTETEVKTGVQSGGIITEKISASNGKGSSSQGKNTSAQNDFSGKGIININTADADLLTEISGIGPSTAQKIIDYRTNHGYFKSVNELLNVSGIGEKTLAKIKDRLCV